MTTARTASRGTGQDRAILEDVPHDVIWLPAHLVVDPPDVLADDAEHQHQQAADHQDENHDRRPAVERNVMPKAAVDDVDRVDEPEERSEHANERDEPDWQI